MPPSPEIGYRNQLDSFIILSDKLGTTWEKLDRAVQNRQPESGRALPEKNVNMTAHLITHSSLNSSIQQLNEQRMQVDRDASKAAFCQLISIARKLYANMLEMCNATLVVCNEKELHSVVVLGRDTTDAWQGAVRGLEESAVRYGAIAAAGVPLKAFEA